MSSLYPDKAYRLFAHNWWLSPGIPASSTTKSGLHEIAEILLKVSSKHQKSIILSNNVGIHFIFQGLLYHTFFELIFFSGITPKSYKPCASSHGSYKTSKHCELLLPYSMTVCCNRDTHSEKQKNNNKCMLPMKENHI